MLTPLLYFLFFETAQPSHATFLGLMPAEVVVSSQSAKALFPQTAPSLKPETAPIKKTESIGPVVEAEAVYAIDLESGMPLFVRNIFTRRPMASISKLVTAMVILDHHKLYEKLTVSRRAAAEEGSQMNLVPGEEITVENALTGMLINSGNDAALALAEFDAKTEEAFVTKMNAKALELGLKDTHFSNAKGFDEEGNYSTPFDIMIFSRAALEYPFIRSTTSKKRAEVSSTDGKTKHKLLSTNELLENPHFQVIGLKTGRTPGAGESFVSLTKGPNDHEILIVLLGSPDRFKETKIVIDWVLRNFEFP